MHIYMVLRNGERMVLLIMHACNLRASIYYFSLVFRSRSVHAGYKYVIYVIASDNTIQMSRPRRSIKEWFELRAKNQFIN
jgi:hypothetical protein